MLRNPKNPGNHFEGRGRRGSLNKILPYDCNVIATQVLKDHEVQDKVSNAKLILE